MFAGAIRGLNRVAPVADALGRHERELVLDHFGFDGGLPRPKGSRLYASADFLMTKKTLPTRMHPNFPAAHKRRTYRGCIPMTFAASATET